MAVAVRRIPWTLLAANDLDRRPGDRAMAALPAPTYRTKSSKPPRRLIAQAQAAERDAGAMSRHADHHWLANEWA